MNIEKVLYIVNKKAKEIRDLLQFYKDNGNLKEFRILLGMLCGPGAEERLQETIIAMRKKKKYLYAVKYTFLKKFGKPVDVSLRKSKYGMGMSELYLIYEYRGDRYHMPATMEQVVQAGYQIPDHYDMGDSPIPSLAEPINEVDVKEALDILLDAIGDTPLQDSPYNMLPMKIISTSSYGVRDSAECQERQVRVFKGFNACKRYMSLGQMFK